MPTRQRITIRLSSKDLRALDSLRGGVDRSSFIQVLVRRAARSGGKPAATPTREEALALVAMHAESDPRAALRREERLTQDADLERLRALTTDPAPEEPATPKPGGSR